MTCVTFLSVNLRGGGAHFPPWKVYQNHDLQWGKVRPPSLKLTDKKVTLCVMFRSVETFLEAREVKKLIKIADLHMFSWQKFAMKTCVNLRF